MGVRRRRGGELGGGVDELRGFEAGEINTAVLQLDLSLEKAQPTGTEKRGESM